MAGLLVLFYELKRITELTPEGAAEVLGTDYLGMLPPLVSGSRLRLLDGPGEDAIRRRLPAPAPAPGG